MGKELGQEPETSRAPAQAYEVVLPFSSCCCETEAQRGYSSRESHGQSLPTQRATQALEGQVSAPSIPQSSIFERFQEVDGCSLKKQECALGKILVFCLGQRRKVFF